jgi:hypothetical protein
MTDLTDLVVAVVPVILNLFQYLLFVAFAVNLLLRDCMECYHKKTVMKRPPKKVK